MKDERDKRRPVKSCGLYWTLACEREKTRFLLSPITTHRLLIQVNPLKRSERKIKYCVCWDNSQITIHEQTKPGLFKKTWDTFWAVSNKKHCCLRESSCNVSANNQKMGMSCWLAEGRFSFIFAAPDDSKYREKMKSCTSQKHNYWIYSQ